ncbi:glutathione-dependent formaldehyde dehydrogenase [Microbacteriaceae bacterium VKM Ac-2855]|nr:glutathione-dependent formaldehyde dehydrogenase [Microbacteriaceae bacterium VKM Ac-2855]
MKAVTWQGKRNIRVDDVEDPRIQEPTDAIIRITSTAICGSDLHLYELFGPFLDAGDILGHESMGVVEAVGSDVTGIAVGDRVVVPFTIACGHCFMCERGLQSQCETTQVTEFDSGAALYGYTKLYGQIPGGQAERLRVHRADANLIRVGTELPDERYLFLSDILPTAWQGVEYADVPENGSVVVFGLGPVGQFAARIAKHRGYAVVAVDPVPERRAMAERHGIATHDAGDDVVETLRSRFAGRGPDAVIDAVGMEAHGSPVAAAAQAITGILPKPLARAMMQTAGVDRLVVLHNALDLVRRGGTVSLSGVYGGEADPMPMMSMFDKQVTLRMGQCNVRRWIDDILPLVEDPSDPLGTEDLVTHHVGIDEAPAMYSIFQKKEDGCIKVVLHPVS